MDQNDSGEMAWTPERKRAYQRDWIARRRAAFFAGKTCETCGSTERLELDHIDRTQKVTHKIWSSSKAKREAEIAKCRVLCHECHKARSRVQMSEHRTLHPVITSKLVENDVREIRRQAAAGVPYPDIAKRFGVHRATISDIMRGKSWGRVA
jgi:hypothetical protein